MARPYSWLISSSSRGGGRSSNLGGPLLNFHLHSSLGGASRHLARTRSEAGNKVKSLQFPLHHHPQDQLPIFLVQNSNLICGFLGEYSLLGNIWGSLNSPPQAKIFKILCLKWWYKSNLVMGLDIDKTSLVEH